MFECKRKNQQGICHLNWGGVEHDYMLLHVDRVCSGKTSSIELRFHPFVGRVNKNRYVLAKIWIFYLLFVEP